MLYNHTAFLIGQNCPSHPNMSRPFSTSFSPLSIIRPNNIPFNSIDVFMYGLQATNYDFILKQLEYRLTVYQRYNAVILYLYPFIFN